MVCIGQLVLIAGDLNADPAFIPCLSKGISSGRFVDLALAYSRGAGLAPDATCRFNREEGTGSRRDFFVGCPNARAASDACYVTDRWFIPHFSVLARFRIGAWMADVACPVVCQPFWPACWLDTPDWSSSSSTRVVQDVWDIYRDELGVVPEEVALALRDAVSRSSVDDFWSIWSKSGEAGLFGAYSRAGGPTEAGSSAFLGRGLLRICSRRLGGRAAGGTSSSRLYRVSHGDDVDKHCAQYFVNSSLSPVLLFCRCLKSVADVVLLLIGGSLLISLLLIASVLMLGWLMLLAMCLLFGMLSLAQLLMIFGLFGVKVLRRVYFGPTISAKIITVLTRYRPIVLELI